MELLSIFFVLQWTNLFSWRWKRNLFPGKKVPRTKGFHAVSSQRNRKRRLSCTPTFLRTMRRYILWCRRDAAQRSYPSGKHGYRASLPVHLIVPYMVGKSQNLLHANDGPFYELVSLWIWTPFMCHLLPTRSFRLRFNNWHNTTWNHVLTIRCLRRHPAGVIPISKSFLLRPMGCHPPKYITQLRMNYARELLVTQLYSVSAVAEQCGFLDA